MRSGIQHSPIAAFARSRVYNCLLVQPPKNRDNESGIMKLKISELRNSGDQRGYGFTFPAEALDFLGRIADMHLASTLPGAIRGNHYHVGKREALVFLPGARWSLHWDEGADTSLHQHAFDGSACVLVLISPGCSHAVRNDGDKPLWLVACSSEPYDPATVVARKVI